MSSINFISQDDIQERIAVVNDSGGFSKLILSPLSIEILHAALEKRISIVFAQGPLRLSPLISVILALEGENDILIGVPRRQFAELSYNYERNFLSLHDQGSFFYERVLWCSADVDSQNAGFMIKDVATRPKWGRRDYKSWFEAQLSNSLANGSCYNWPRILCIPIDNVLPDNLLGNTAFTFRNLSYKLAPFSPKFVILESVNERVFSAEPVIALLKSMSNRALGGVIHFSWPYSPSVGRLIDSIPRIEKETGKPLAVIHMGKRYCNEMKASFSDYVTRLDKYQSRNIDWFLGDHRGFKEFSIEGKTWHDYYPDLSKIDLKNHLVLGVVDFDRTAGLKRLRDLAEAEGPFDSLLEETSSALPEAEESKSRMIWRSMVLFPPFVDSFLLPEETKLFCETEYGEYRALPIKDALHIKMAGSASVLGSFTNLCAQMDSVADFQHVINGISTYNSIGKSTALLCYIYNVIKSWRTPEECLMICDFNSNMGFRKGLLQRVVNLIDMLQRTPETSAQNVSPVDYIKSFIPAGERFDLPPGNGIVKELKYETKSSGREINIQMTLNHTNDAGASITSEKSIQILMIDFDQIVNASSSIRGKNVTLLLPGPIPVFSFRDETPVITKGFDGLLKPFSRIIMLTFAGDNLRRSLEQIEIMDELVSPDTSSLVCQTDLALSVKQAPKSLVVGIENPAAMQVEKPEEIVPSVEESPLDISIRKMIISNEQKKTQNRAKTLQEVWDSIASKGPAPPSYQPSYSTSMTDITFDVRFPKDMREERIALNPISYVRVIDASGTSLCLSENLRPGQKIAFLKSDTKESLDNFFIRNFSESRGWTLEDVFEPFTCLSHFYESLSETDFEKGYEDENFAKLFWLSPVQRKSVFALVQFLLHWYSGSIDQHYSNWKRVIAESGIWKPLQALSKEQVYAIKCAFHHTPVITPEKLHLIAEALGMVYDPSSFKSTINQVVSGEKRYYFQNPQNLLAIGKLLENNRIIERYEEITAAGKAVRVVLELEGFSISRVLAGKENPLNDMDSIVKDRMMICEILGRAE